ncbi:MAG: hypothetical protein IJR59_00460 [Firmicutes bacterium]|nr:hypothetical protein [Bacillota bacterium]
MGLFDFLKPKKGKGFDNWRAESDMDKFTGIELSDVESYVSRIDDLIYEFVIFTPPEPVDGCDMLMICKEDGFRVEISVKGDHSMNKVYAKTGLSAAEAVAIVADMADKGVIPKVEEMKNLGTSGDPKKTWLERKLHLHNVQ